jgi:hypothetical protein
MNGPTRKLARCAIYTRKSTEYNLELAFNTLDAQREACEAYIKSQAHEGWRLIPTRYDDGACRRGSEGAHRSVRGARMRHDAVEDDPSSSRRNADAARRGQGSPAAGA